MDELKNLKNLNKSKKKMKEVKSKKRVCRLISFLLVSMLFVIFLTGVVLAESGEAHTNFSLVDAQPSCYINSADDVSFWVFWDQPSNEVIWHEIGVPMPPKYSCYDANGWPSTGCCPDDIQCVVYNAHDHYEECYGAAPQFCSDYDEINYGSLEAAEAYCEGFNINVAIRSMEDWSSTTGICSGFYSEPIIPPLAGYSQCDLFTGNCKCFWDESDDQCKPSSTGYTVCDGEIIGDGGECQYTTIDKQDNCIDRGLITYVWQALWTGATGTEPSWCVNGERTFNCSTVKLAFFTTMNIILFVLITFFIYFFMNKNKFYTKE